MNGVARAESASRYAREAARKRHVGGRRPAVHARRARISSVGIPKQKETVHLAERHTTYSFLYTVGDA